MMNDTNVPDDVNDTSEFRRDLAALLTSHSVEGGSNTPDYILAQYLQDCLSAFDKAVNHREAWHGRPFDNGDAPPPPREPMKPLTVIR